MKLYFNKLALIGVGLIGGSLAIDCKKKGLVGSISGFGRSEGNLKKAVTLGVIDQYDLKIEKVVEGADLVVLAIPVGSYGATVKKILPYLSKEAIMTDVGSVKGKVVEELGPLFKNGKFVPAHPIAGREKSGVDAALPDLFKGARCILTPTPRTDPASLAKVRKLWEKVGAVVSCLDPFEHDDILGMVSHLPHLAAYALVNTVLGMAEKKESLVSYSGGGFRDFTRIGASSPEMWKDICLSNREAILGHLKKYEETLGRLKKYIEDQDGAGLLKEFEKSKKILEKLN
ncbi:MAG: prephenate dehydrogenase/arogenate dehydrogenase family protein [Nitrospirae bacterium]|nr:prephenate dehydrogenase/arogenate dehydrogenase family protein [Nitrospirota bacterium]MBI3353128.1 prephenate dehydrogenase/arogenate dehydrogenase family protein [Nitrospirota bacterium]